MATTASTLSQAELLSRLSAIATTHNGTALTAADGTITGTLTAIKAKWLLGGRKVTSNFTCNLDSANHAAHFRESAVESSWGLPPPSFTVQTTSQYGSRVNTTRTDTSVGGGGKLEFGKFREEVELAVKAAGWEFVFEVVGMWQHAAPYRNCRCEPPCRRSTARPRPASHRHRQEHGQHRHQQ